MYCAKFDFESSHHHNGFGEVMWIMSDLTWYMRESSFTFGKNIVHNIGRENQEIHGYVGWAL